MIGQRISSYRIVRTVGDGGTSTVYEALNEDIGRRVAVKVLHESLTQDRELVRRFFQEARAVNIIQHPGIVSVLECGQQSDGVAYIVMEYLEGESLAERLRHCVVGLPVAEALRLSRQLASALSVAHQKGIIHRDVKPSNIMIVPDGEAPGGERTKLLDFGLAKLSVDNLSDSKRLEVTRPGTTMGTPVYMSPEQFQGAQVDSKSDVYSLGVTMYQMLAGHPPFGANNTAEMSAAHLYRTPRPLTELSSDVSDQLDVLVRSMLAKKPLERPGMEQVVRTLENLGAPKATDSISIVRRPSQGMERMPSEWVDPLASTIGQIATRTQRWLRGSLVRRAFFVVLLALIVIAPAALLLSVRLSSKTTPQTAMPSPVAALIAPVPSGGTDAAAGRPGPRPASSEIRLSIVTEPAGAEVLRVADGVLLGKTPWHSTRRMEQGHLPVLLRLPGFHEQRLDLDLRRDDERREQLQPLRAAKMGSDAEGRPSRSKKRGTARIAAPDPMLPASLPPDMGELTPRIVE